MIWRPSTREIEPIDECPVGKILRETPHVYQAVQMYGYAESGSLNIFDCSSWLRSAMSIVGSEYVRHSRRRDEQRKAEADAMAARRGVMNE